MNEITHTITIDEDDFPTVFTITETPPTVFVMRIGQKHSETYKKFLHKNLSIRHQHINDLIKDTLKRIIALNAQDGANLIKKQIQESNSSLEIKNELGLNLTEELFTLLGDQTNDLDELARVLGY